MPNLGLSELIVILMILLLVFGASRLPALGESLGRTIKGFKRGIATDDQISVQSDSGSGEGAKPKPTADDVDEADIVDTKKG